MYILYGIFHKNFLGDETQIKGLILTRNELYYKALIYFKSFTPLRTN